MNRLPTRGAASLIVVLLLFLVLSLTAAYTSRNLIFEQKTSANQARSTAAFEAAEAGIEWTLTQLNGARVDDNCIESNVAGAASFQQRYLTIAPSGYITQTIRAASSSVPRVWPTCVYSGAGWNCACPVNGPIDPTPPGGIGSAPAFRIWPAVEEALTGTSSPWTPFPAVIAGIFPLNVAGCTRLPSGAAGACLDYLPRGEIGEGLAGLRVTLVLRSGLATVPAAAITARVEAQPFDPAPSTAPKLAVTNTDQRSNGFTVNTAMPIDKSRFIAKSIPGTPSEFSFAPDDAKLIKVSIPAPAGSSTYGPELTGGERMFVTTFGMKRQTYKDQPGVRKCPPPCSAAAINTLMVDNPNRIIWVEGDLTLNANIGTPGSFPPAPVLLIVDGRTLTLGPAVQVYGFVYMTGGLTNTSTIDLPDTATGITGALVAEGRLVTTYSGGAPAATSFLTVTYDAAALELMRTTYGSWVRLAGSWRDFKGTP